MENNRKKSRTIANVKFWSQFALESLGLTVGVAVAMLIFYGIRNIGSLENMIAMLPYYLVIAGAFIIMITGIGCFQVTFSLLMSMNVTRKAVVWGILLSETAIAGCILLASMEIWHLVPSDISKGGIELFPLIGGVLFGGMSLISVLGVVIIRWGKIGFVLSVACYAIMGAGLGVSFVSAGEHTAVLQRLTDHAYGGVLIAGVILYLLSSVFVFWATSKMEVRV